MRNPQHHSKPRSNGGSARSKNPSHPNSANRPHANARSSNSTNRSNGEPAKPHKEPAKPAPRDHMALYLEDSPPPRRQYSYGGASFSPESLRKGFIKKVLVIVTLMLSISALAMGTTYIESLGIRQFLLDHLYLFYVVVSIHVFLVIIFICKRDALGQVPYNYILVFAFTLTTSYILALVAAVTDSQITLFAGVCTIAVVIAIALYATFIKTDLTKKGMFLGSLVLVLIIVSILSFTIRSRYLEFIYSGIWGMIYAVFLAFAIQKLIGKYEIKYSLDEYLNAALELYLDIVNLFLIILIMRRKASKFS